MDLALIKTFVEVAASGSFVSAAERLYVTQSAVSLRIQRLEDQLGRPLFTRSKSGAELTSAGREFESFAQALLRNWEQARQQVAIPEGFSRSLTIGAQVSLWPRLGFRWIDALRAALPNLGLHAQLGLPDSLTRSMTEGVMQISLTYVPTLRPGLSVEKVLDDELVLVAPWENPTREQLPGRYAFVDWGGDFLHFHDSHLPKLSNPGLTLTMGSLSVRFILSRDFAAYLPARTVKKYIDDGRLHLVPDAPTYAYPAWSVWRDDLEDDLATVAHATLRSVIELAKDDTTEVLEQI
ncbi:LysR family transcriptional regulator [Phaeovulum sp.]|uniref:LysR family transcriptional regulator n=1 Tax=Phaeovulum sp. TaxID=2934796 RepID=UPI003567A83F